MRLRHSDTIIADVARAFNVPKEVMLSETRIEAVTRPRFAAMKIMREQRALSLPAIARILKRKDHTTVWSGIQRADELIANDPGFRDAYERARQG